MMSRLLLLCVIALVFTSGSALADPPSVSYIFPAGGQRGTTTEFKVGGHNLHDAAAFEMYGQGVKAVDRIKLTDTLFFEGPVIPQPASQRKENYPRDYAGRVTIAADAEVGNRYWHVTTSQGITAGMKFVVGDLPEVVEKEIDGAPIPTAVTLPVTINGRIFPREDIDIWTFEAKAGRPITCTVNAERIGSPLDSRLEIRDPSGRRIAENVDAFGTDSRVRFTPAVDGRYEVRIHDVTFAGLQHYVYRLTITDGPVVDSVFPLGGPRGSKTTFHLTGANLPQQRLTVDLPLEGPKRFKHNVQIAGHSAGIIPLELDELPEVVEAMTGDQPQLVVLPIICNGRIAHAGEVDRWTFKATKGQKFQVALSANRLGSPLDSVLTIFDSTGKQLLQNDDTGSKQTDSRLTFNVPVDGTYVVQVEDRLPSRGGMDFAYRLKIAPIEEAAPGFRLTLPADVATIERGNELKLKIDVQRLSGFKEEIELAVDNLPPGVTVVQPAKIDKGKNNAQLTLKAEELAKVATARLKVWGKAMIGDRPVEQRARLHRTGGDPDVEELRLRVAVPPPFKYTAEFATRYASRGTVYSRHYSLDRGDFEGPIEIRMADVQARHLQGVKGPVMTIPPSDTEFDYQITLPPWMKIGRTSRTCIMAVGEVIDPDGTRHKVSYSSTTQDDQIIVLVDPARLSVRANQPSVRAIPGKSVRVPFQIERATGLKGDVTVDLVIPRHITGVDTEPAEVTAAGNSGELLLTFRSKQPGPFNMPLTLQATMQDEEGNPITAETPLEIVPAR